METYVSLLRGINVGGHQTVPMDRLRSVYASLGYTDVATYIQSGNVVFTARHALPSTFARAIEGAIEDAFRMKVTVVVRRRADLERVVRRCPFAPSPRLEAGRIGIAFLASRPPAAMIRDLLSLPLRTADRFEISRTEVYLACPDGFGTTVFTNTFLEKALGTRATTRNLRTVNALLDMTLPPRRNIPRETARTSRDRRESR
jgi:uncharacterized protein (DUF1697 family)